MAKVIDPVAELDMLVVVCEHARHIERPAALAFAKAAAIARRDVHDVLLAREHIVHHAIDDLGVRGAHLGRPAFAIDQRKPFRVLLEGLALAQVKRRLPTVPKHRRLHPTQA